MFSDAIDPNEPTLDTIKGYGEEDVNKVIDQFISFRKESLAS